MLKIDLPKPTNCGDCFLCRAGKCEKAYEAYLKMGSMFFKAVFEPHFMLDDCPIEEIDEAQIPKRGEWIAVIDWLQIPQEDSGTYRCSACGQVMKYPWNYCPNCGSLMRGDEECAE